MKSMNYIIRIIALSCSLVGCATIPADYEDAEFSDMPWNTPKEWEGSRQIPGLSGPGRGY